MLASCNSYASTPAINLTASNIETIIVETQTTIATSTFTPILLPSPSALPPTETSTPIAEISQIPVSGIPTIIAMENGITWTECVAPSLDYAHSAPDFQFASDCLQGEIPTWNDHDRNIAGEWIGENLDAHLQQVIGNDVYVVKQDATHGCCDYEFLKNGNVVIQTSAPLITFNPNQHLWSIGGKVVWELITDPPTIFVDSVDYNAKYQWEGIFKPYSINDKLLYIAKKSGKYHIVYDEEIIGTEFDEIYIKYCCGTTNVRYGNGQYWFWGKREGVYYIVAIQ